MNCTKSWGLDHTLKGDTFVVMSTKLRQLGCTSRFSMSDSSSVELSLLVRIQPDRTRSNRQNTYWVRRAGLLGQALSLLKADGARSMTPKRSRQLALDYFKVTGGLSSE